MAEAAPDIFGGVDMDRIVQGAMPSGGVDIAGAQKGVQDVAEREAKAKGAATDSMLADLRRDKADVAKAKEGIEPLDVKPWNAEEERKKHSTDPIQAFGSVGVLAAVLASAFTKQPMINALNGAGAAIGAMNERNDKNYEAAYDAFKTNTNLAIKRHEIQREAYQDAITKLDVDHRVGTAALQAVAAKYGDEKALAFIRAGMIPELLQYKNSERQAYIQMASLMPQFEKMNLDRQLLNLDPDWNSDDPGRKASALQRIKQGRLDPTQQIFDQYVRENPGSNAEDRAAFYKDLKNVKPLSPQQFALQRYIDEGIAEGNPRTAEQIQKFLQGMGKQSMPSPNRSVENKAVDDMIAEAKARGEKLDYATALKRFRNETSALPEKEKNVIRTQVDQFDNSVDKIDATLKVLDTHVGAAGIAGRVTRLGERIGNIFGSNNTDRDQFMRDVQYLRLAAGRLLTESRGRPLASEAQKVSDIVAGIDMGDTTANTIRALEELKTLYTKMRMDNLNRLRGTWQPREDRGTGTAPPASDTKGMPWENDPVVGGDKRSEVISDEQPDPIRPGARYAMDAPRGKTAQEHSSYPPVDYGQYDRWLKVESGQRDMWYSKKNHGPLEDAVEKFPEGLLIEREDLPKTIPDNVEVFQIPWAYDKRLFIRRRAAYTS